MGMLQNEPVGHCEPRRPPHTAPVGGVVTHAPFEATETPAAAALHELSYVLPSHPHTGARIASHALGSGTHVPVWSAAPHCPSGKLQYSPLPHCAPTRPPHEE